MSRSAQIIKSLKLKLDDIATRMTTLTSSNSVGLVYLTGDANTDGSLRIRTNAGKAYLEVRTAGAWNITSFSAS